MRYVCKVYEDGTLYAYETSDDAWKLKKVFEGQKPEHVHRVSAFAELSCDNNDIGKKRLKQALAKLQDILNNET
ncbi:MAG: hypothetical protein ACE5PV_14740 [Candidatus Poribacteria bacterium]